MKTIIALGSNSNQEENIFKAQTLLKQRFEGVKFSDTQWTEPIGIKSDKFLNCIGTFDTKIISQPSNTMLKGDRTNYG